MEPARLWLGDAADDLLLVAWECPAEDVDVAGDAARAELGEQSEFSTVCGYSRSCRSKPALL